MLSIDINEYKNIFFDDNVQKNLYIKNIKI